LGSIPKRITRPQLETAMQRWFLIEVKLPDHVFRQHMVKADNYAMACKRIADKYGTPDSFKNLGMFDKLDEDTKLLTKVT